MYDHPFCEKSILLFHFPRADVTTFLSVEPIKRTGNPLLHSISNVTIHSPMPIPDEAPEDLVTTQSEAPCAAVIEGCFLLLVTLGISLVVVSDIPLCSRQCGGWCSQAHLRAYINRRRQRHYWRQHYHWQQRRNMQRKRLKSRRLKGIGQENINEIRKKNKRFDKMIMEV